MGRSFLDRRGRSHQRSFDNPGTGGADIVPMGKNIDGKYDIQRTGWVGWSAGRSIQDKHSRRSPSIPDRDSVFRVTSIGEGGRNNLPTIPLKLRPIQYHEVCRHRKEHWPDYICTVVRLRVPATIIIV